VLAHCSLNAIVHQYKLNFFVYMNGKLWSKEASSQELSGSLFVMAAGTSKPRGLVHFPMSFEVAPPSSFGASPLRSMLG
jgi:hypothetical protein